MAICYSERVIDMKRWAKKQTHEGKKFELSKIGDASVPESPNSDSKEEVVFAMYGRVEVPEDKKTPIREYFVVGDDSDSPYFCNGNSNYLVVVWIDGVRSYFWFDKLAFDLLDPKTYFHHPYFVVGLINWSRA